MAKEIRPLQRYNENTEQTEIFYPATTTDAIAHPTKQKSLTDVIADIETNVAAYDISASHSGATYANLAAALGTNGANVPAAVRKGGMSIKFVNSSDNKYVLWRLTATSFTTDTTKWVAENEDFKNEVMQEVNEAIESITPIEITGDVTNAPDEEDLTSVNQGGTDVLKFKDKAYTPLTYSGMGRVYLRKNLVNGVNTLTQDMFYKGEAGSRVPNTNTIYVIQYDFTLGEDITIPANCVLKFEGGSLSNGTLVLQNTLFDGVVRLGADMEISGTCANQMAYQSWFENNDIDGFIDFINAVGGCANYSFSTGVYNPTKYINKLIEPNGTINIIGNGCKLHYNEINVTTSYFNIAPIEAVSEIIELTAAVNKGDDGISVPDITKFQRGDYILLKDEAISSFNYCRNYGQGEIIKVELVNTDNSRIVPDHFIYGVYTHINEAYNENEELVEGHFVKILKTNFINVNIKDLDIRLIPDLNVAKYYTRGVEIYNAITEINNFNCYNFRYGTKLDCCLNSSVKDCKIQNTRDVGETQDTYGLMIIGSQNILITGCTLYGGRHAITISSHYAAQPSRFITVDSCYCIGYRNGGGINCHGGAEFISIVNCTADGISVGCNEYKVINCNVSGSIQSFDAITFNGVIESNTVGRGIQIKTRYFTGDYVRCMQNYTPNTEKELLVIGNNNVQGDIYVYTSYKGEFKNRLYTNLDNTLIVSKDNSCRNMLFQLVPGTNMDYPDIIEWYQKSARVVVKGNRYNFYGTSGSTYNINCKEIVIEGNNISNYDNENYNRSYKISAETVILKNNILLSNGGNYHNHFFNIANIDNIYVIDNISLSNRPIIGAAFINRQSQGYIYAKDNKSPLLSYVSRNSADTSEYSFDVVSINNKGNTFNNCVVIYKPQYNGEGNYDFDTMIGNVYKTNHGATIKFNNNHKLDIPAGKLLTSYTDKISSGSNRVFSIAYDGNTSKRTFVIDIREMRNDATAERHTLVCAGTDSAYAVVVEKTWPRGTYTPILDFYHDTTNNKFYLKITESLGNYDCNIALSIVASFSGLSNFEIQRDSTTETFTSIGSYGNGVVMPMTTKPTSGLNRRATGELISVNNRLMAFDGAEYHDTDGALGGVKRSGNTNSRPIGSSIYVGFMYFDTSISPARPIYASTISGDTVTWVDATGTTV